MDRPYGHSHFLGNVGYLTVTLSRKSYRIKSEKEDVVLTLKIFRIMEHNVQFPSWLASSLDASQIRYRLEKPLIGS